MKPDYISPDGTVTLYNRDCRDVLPHLTGVDLCLTDPPFGIGFAAQPTKWQRRDGMQPVNWDNAVVDDLPAIISIGEIQVCWGGNYYPLPPSRGWLVWYKPDAPHSMSNVEMAWTNQDRNSRHITCSISSVNPERVGHPTQKPLRVMRWAIEQFPEAESVCDPFMGSGTTGVACVRLGRKFIGIEIDEGYFKIAVKRIEQAFADQALFVPPPVETQAEMFTEERE